MTTEIEDVNKDAPKDEPKGEDKSMPAWAADMMKAIDSIGSRVDAMEKPEDKKEDKDAIDSLEQESEPEDKEAKEILAGKDEAVKAAEEAAEDRARADAAHAKANREMQGKIDALQGQINRMSREPSFEERNEIASIRSRADSVYQSATGRPASEPVAGESAISYRKRMADGLRKFSAKFKGEDIAGLSGSAFEVVENQIYADAMEAAKKPENFKRGQIRAITRNDSGHTITEFIGDAGAAWAPMSAGAVMTVKLNKPN